MLDAISLQQISQLLDKKLDEKFDEKLAPIKATLDEHTRTLNEHSQKFITIDKRFDGIDKKLKQHDKMLRSLKKDQVLILDVLDRDQIKLRKRLDEVEGRLGYTSAVV